MKPQQSSFEQTMLTLKTVGTAQEMQFRQATDALRACDDYEATLSAAQLALHRLCADPLLFASTRASVPGAGAAKLMAALGYRSAGGAHFVFEGAKSPVVLRRLALATKALDAFRADERARRATAKFAALPAEPSPGASGTAEDAAAEGSYKEDAPEPEPETERDAKRDSLAPKDTIE